MSVLFMLNGKKEGSVEHFGIGTATAEFTQEMMDEHPELENQIQLFCNELCKQFELDAVRVYGIEFSSVRYE